MKHEAFFNTHVWYTSLKSKPGVGRHTRAYACNAASVSPLLSARCWPLRRQPCRQARRPSGSSGAPSRGLRRACLHLGTRRRMCARALARAGRPAGWRLEATKSIDLDSALSKCRLLESSPSSLPLLFLQRVSMPTEDACVLCPRSCAHLRPQDHRKDDQEEAVRAIHGWPPVRTAAESSGSQQDAQCEWQGRPSCCPHRFLITPVSLDRDMGKKNW